MNVHFFVTFAKDASNSVFAQELKKQNISFEIFSERINLRYTQRFWLYFIGWPRIMSFAVRQAWRSLRSVQKPDWIVVGSHFEVLAFTILVTIFRLDRPKIMLMGFIYTSRKSPLMTKLKYLYFSNILKWVDCVVCHSTQETENNEKLFLSSKTRFAYIPYGLHLELPERGIIETNGESYAVSAGRSGRDYELLIRCFSQLGYPLHIICDSKSEIKDQALPENIQILRNCYGNCYINQIANAKIVVIPISVNDISAGQMVLLQAMALQKPVIITNTNTTCLYVEHEKTAILIEKGNLEQMEMAVKELWANPELATKMAINGKISFEENYSMAAFINNLCAFLMNYS